MFHLTDTKCLGVDVIQLFDFESGLFCNWHTLMHGEEVDRLFFEEDFGDEFTLFLDGLYGMFYVVGDLF
jgi:hypothetical protein